MSWPEQRHQRRQDKGCVEVYEDWQNWIEENYPEDREIIGRKPRMSSSGYNQKKKIKDIESRKI